MKSGGRFSLGFRLFSLSLGNTMGQNTFSCVRLGIIMLLELPWGFLTMRMLGQDSTMENSSVGDFPSVYQEDGSTMVYSRASLTVETTRFESFPRVYQEEVIPTISTKGRIPSWIESVINNAV